jgi:hypothetical protein
LKEGADTYEPFFVCQPLQKAALTDETSFLVSQPLQNSQIIIKTSVSLKNLLFWHLIHGSFFSSISTFGKRWGH